MKALADVVPDRICAGTSTLSDRGVRRLPRRNAGVLDTRRDQRGQLRRPSRKGRDGRRRHHHRNSRNIPIEEIGHPLPDPDRALRAPRPTRRPRAMARRHRAASASNRFLDDGVSPPSRTGRTRRRGAFSAAARGCRAACTRIDPDGRDETLSSKMTNLPMDAGVWRRGMQASGRRIRRPAGARPRGRAARRSATSYVPPSRRATTTAS